MSDMPQPARAARRFKWLLGVSLALNLAIVGLIIGAVFHGHPGPSSSHMRSGFALVAALEREDRKAVLQGLRERGREQRQAHRGYHEALLDQLRSEEFSPDTLRGLVTESANGLRDVQDEVAERLLARLSEMSLQERRDYADRVERKLRRSARP